MRTIYPCKPVNCEDLLKIIVVQIVDEMYYKIYYETAKVGFGACLQLFTLI